MSAADRGKASESRGKGHPGMIYSKPGEIYISTIYNFSKRKRIDVMAGFHGEDERGFHARNVHCPESD